MHNFKTGDFDRDLLKQWADSRETSIEVAEAIFMIGGSEEQAARIWQDPTPTEIHHIAARATQNHKLDANEMQWGVQTLADALARI